MEKGVFVAALIVCSACRSNALTPPPPDATPSVESVEASLAADVDAGIDASEDAARPAPLPTTGELAAPFRGTYPHGWVAATNGASRVIANLGEERSPNAIPIASFTKLWTAVAALQLVREKKLALTETIADILPSLRGRAWSDSTVAELMSHTSKVPEFDGPSGYFRDRDVSFEDPLAAITKYVPRVTEKRGTFKYRNAEYAMVGALVAARAGEPLPDVLAKRIFAPAHMTHSGLLVEPHAAPAAVDLRSLGPVRAQNFFAAGAGYSTPEDLLAFFDALASDSLLDDASKKLLFDGQKDRGNWGALGCWAYPMFDSLVVERTGTLGEMKLFSAFFPEEKRAIVAWSSTSIDFGHPASARLPNRGIGYDLTRLISDSSSAR